MQPTSCGQDIGVCAFATAALLSGRAVQILVRLYVAVIPLILRVRRFKEEVALQVPKYGRHKPVMGYLDRDPFSLAVVQNIPHYHCSCRIW